MSKTSTSTPSSISGVGLRFAAVEAEDRQAGGLVDGVADLRVDQAADAVLGAEQRDQLDLGGLVQHVDGGAAVARPAGVVRNQSDTLPLERFELALDQHVDTAVDLMDGIVGRDRGVGDGRGDDRGELASQGDRRRLVPLRVQPAGEQDDEGVGLGIDPEAGAGEAGVAEAAGAEPVAARGAVAGGDVPAEPAPLALPACRRGRSSPAPWPGSGCARSFSTHPLVEEHLGIERHVVGGAEQPGVAGDPAQAPGPRVVDDAP